ncbi:MAG: HAD-IIA family hydrolase [Balneolales bacterium]|nr:HAD-IIA family hydrolase [Balneolales bacterium]
MDGVVLHDNDLIPGADTFLHDIIERGIDFRFITNYPSQTPADLYNRLLTAGVEVPVNKFFTSAMATASFLLRQEGRKAYVIGEGALTHELYKIGFSITDIDPDVVIVGETKSYNWEMIRKAAYFVKSGARFIATNPDVAGPGGSPACGALCAPIERISGKSPFYIGKPNAFMIRAALDSMKAHTESSIIIGDNMHTDILAGVQAGLESVLVLTGYSQKKDLAMFPYRPNHIYESLEKVDLESIGFAHQK